MHSDTGDVAAFIPVGPRRELAGMSVDAVHLGLHYCMAPGIDGEAIAFASTRGMAPRDRARVMAPGAGNETHCMATPRAASAVRS